MHSSKGVLCGVLAVHLIPGRAGRGLAARGWAWPRLRLGPGSSRCVAFNENCPVWNRFDALSTYLPYVTHVHDLVGSGHG